VSERKRVPPRSELRCAGEFRGKPCGRKLADVCRVVHGEVVIDCWRCGHRNVVVGADDITPST
jgi:hypothetical protein